MLNGQAVQYYGNNDTAAVFYFENGKRNGYARTYDTSGHLSSTSYVFYDIKSGPLEEYVNGKLNAYFFYSLGDSLLIYLSYDSLRKGKMITEVQSDYFFLQKYDFGMLSDSGWGGRNTEYLLYTPNPPGFNFQYSFVTVDSSFHVISVIREFDRTKPWSIFETLRIQNRRERMAIRLEVNDPVAGRITLFRILKD
jgi:hypothetical protein